MREVDLSKIGATCEPSVSFAGDVPIRTYAAHGGAGRAAVLFFHGLRSSAVALDPEARAIAAAGIAALVPDAPHHGARRDRALEAMPDTATREGYGTLLAILREARDEVPSLVDHALGLGYERVAIGGVSMGGYIALAGAVVEPRLAAVVSLLGSPDWTPHEGEAAKSVHHFAGALAESPHLRAEALAPRPLLLLNGKRDANVPPEPARALERRLRPLYDRLGAGDVLVRREYDVDHFAPPDVWREMVETAVGFLARTLPVEASRGEPGGAGPAHVSRPGS
jgi:alpha-beta hydrolase superfamily lysophospholipase